MYYMQNIWWFVRDFSMKLQLRTSLLKTNSFWSVFIKKHARKVASQCFRNKCNTYQIKYSNEGMNKCNGFNSKRSLQCCANEPVTTGDNKISCKHKLTN